MLTNQRSSGILLPVYALLGMESVGTFGKEAYSFIDFLSEADQHVWQILPLGPSGDKYSPYKSLSAFAGNPAFISLETLVEEGLLSRDALPEKKGMKHKVDHQKVMRQKMPLLRKAFAKTLKIDDPRYQRQFKRFCKLNAYWLEDFALFTVLTEKYKTAHWRDWDKKTRDRDETTIRRLLKEHSRELQFQKFLQFLFIRQWLALKHYAKSNQVQIFGDLPIFISFESADVWANPEYFMLNDDKAPLRVAGVPPDYFSETGQLWGNPQYNWKTMKRSGYEWWIQRLSWNLELFDLLRIDHFRGFEASWSIPAGAKDAITGQWVKAPGRALLKQAQKKFGVGSLVAEDLGYITPEVEYLRDEFELPGMRVLQFAFDGKENNAHLPHEHIKNSIAYTGTHDNDTLEGWYRSLERKQRSFIKKYIHSDGKDIVWDLIGSVWASSSKLAITTMQDLLSLGSDARTNHPGRDGDNWAWRISSAEIPSSIVNKLSEITRLYGRA